MGSVVHWQWLAHALRGGSLSVPSLRLIRHRTVYSLLRPATLPTSLVRCGREFRRRIVPVGVVGRMC